MLIKVILLSMTLKDFWLYIYVTLTNALSLGLAREPKACLTFLDAFYFLTN